MTASGDRCDVLLVDDQELVRTGFRLIPETEPGLRVVGEAADGAAAVDAVRRLRPDVVLMDVQMPVMDGIEAARRLAELPVPTKVVILTTFERDDLVIDALRAGASGFLLKNAHRISWSTRSGRSPPARHYSRPR